MSQQYVINIQGAIKENKIRRLNLFILQKNANWLLLKF